MKKANPDVWRSTPINLKSFGKKPQLYRGSMLTATENNGTSVREIETQQKILSSPLSSGRTILRKSRNNNNNLAVVRWDAALAAVALATLAPAAAASACGRPAVGSVRSLSSKPCDPGSTWS